MTKANSDISAPWRSLYPNCSRELIVNGYCYHYLDSAAGDGVSSRGEATGTLAPHTSKRVPSLETSKPAPVILCVHGNPTWSFYWRRVIERFGSTYRVIAVDHIGCGLSDKPARGDFAYTLAAHRDNLLQLIDQLDLRQVILLAHDWGGAIGLSAAVQRVERMAGVLLLNTAAFPPPYVPWRIAVCRTPFLGGLAMRGGNVFARAAVTMAMSKQRLSPAVAQGLLYPYNNWNNRVAIDSFVKDIPLSRRHETYQVLKQLEADLGKLSHLPKLLVWGMKDWCFRPECLERFLKHWPDATAVRIADAGHYVIEDDPDTTLDAIATFLQRWISENEKI
jgi:cis-3-alkyl-4-acyloxetan-2-one decarboxylase